MRAFDSHRSARLLLLATYAVLFAVPFVGGYVVAPHNNRPEAGESGPATDEYPSNRIFTDHSFIEIPELDHHLTGDRHSWLGGWNPHVQLGRPSMQWATMSPAYLLVNLIACVSSNAHWVYTAFALLTLGLIGFFTFLFLEELKLHPAACYVGGVGLSLSIFCSFWLTFALFLSTICWTVALLWLVTLYVNRRTWWALPGIAFSVYSLLATGYPVLIVLFGYTLAAYGLWILFPTRHGLRESLVLLAHIAGAAAVGVLAALPIYLDLLEARRASARLEGVTDAFLLATFPSFAGWRDALSFVATNVDPFAMGNPNRHPYPGCANGILLSPLYFMLVGVSCAQGGSRRFWFWFLAAGLYGLLNTWSPAYLFAVHHLGLGLSRCRCMWGALIPASVLAAMAVDDLLRNRPSRRAWACWGASAIALAAIYVGLACGGKHVSYRAAVASATLVLLVGLCLRTRWPALIAGLAVGSSILYGSYVALLRPLATICDRSPLTRALRETGDGSCRYAKIGAVYALPPNEDAFLGLCSVHSYDSLSSGRYQRLLSTWSGQEAQDYGRWFNHLDTSFRADAPERLAWAGVKYLLADKPLDVPWAEAVERIDGLHVFRSKLEPKILFQTRAFVRDGPHAVRLTADAARHGQPARYAARQDDWRRVLTHPQEGPSLLFVSEQFHPHWRARSKGDPLTTVSVDEFYLGVVLPPGTEDLELEFVPFARWSWIPQAGFVLLGLAFALQKVVTAITASSGRPS